jgi:hypothetical protein
MPRQHFPTAQGAGRAQPTPPEPVEQLAVLISPIKARAVKKTIVSKTDVEVWSLPDQEIVGQYQCPPGWPALYYFIYSEASKSTWHSKIYDHYNISLRREVDNDGEPLKMVFAFSCKVDPVCHTPHLCSRMLSGHGTKNLQDGVNACNKCLGVISDDATQHTGAPYLPAGHRTMIAMCCAKNHRPFNSVLDEDYQAEVEMLWPGTILPLPQTVSHDIKAIYAEMSKNVCNYFMVCF